MIPQLDRSYFALAREGATPGTDAAYRRGLFRERSLQGGLSLISLALWLSGLTIVESLLHGRTPDPWPSREIQERALLDIGFQIAILLLGFGILGLAVARWWPRKRWNDRLFAEIRRIFANDPDAASVTVQGGPRTRQTIRYACAPYALVMEEPDVLQLHGPDLPKIQIDLGPDGTPRTVTVQDGRPGPHTVRDLDQLGEEAQSHVSHFAATMLKLRSQHIG
jgi:hypothetical protein